MCRNLVGRLRMGDQVGIASILFLDGRHHCQHSSSAKAIPKSPLFCFVGAGVITGEQLKNPRRAGTPLTLLVVVEVVDLTGVVEDVEVAVGKIMLDTRQVQALDSLLGLHVVGA